MPLVVVTSSVGPRTTLDCLRREQDCCVIECKRELGDLTPAQEAWLDALHGVPFIEVYIARPSSLDEILDALD